MDKKNDEFGWWVLTREEQKAMSLEEGQDTVEDCNTDNCEQKSNDNLAAAKSQNCNWGATEN